MFFRKTMILLIVAITASTIFIESAKATNDIDLSHRRTLRSSLDSIRNLIRHDQIRVAFFDADGTLRPSIKPGQPPQSPKEVVLLPGVASKMREKAKEGFLVAIVSNQAGIPRYVSLEKAEQTMAKTAELLERQGAHVDYFDFAENYDEDRKPEAGMARRLEDILKKELGVIGIDREHSFMVGDAAWMRASKNGPAETRPDGRPGFNHSNADRLFAANFDIPFQEAADFFEWRLRYGIDTFELLSDLSTFLESHPEIKNSEYCESALVQKQGI